MKHFYNINSSQETIKSLEVNVDTVYIRTNIHRIETEDFTGWQYDEIQYSLREYMEILAQQEDVKAVENRLLSPIEIYERLDIESTPLEQFKHHKLNQLNELCNKAIVAGFMYEINNITYLFSASLEAQSNFIATNSMFADGLIQDVEWTVINTEAKVAERIPLTQEEFNIVKMIMFGHVNTQITKFRNVLQPQVLEATTNEEVDSIEW